ncbi:MAG: DedA family protein [Bacteroidetes bacterium]|nr:DedA family protein [Bacteroidota bacterium]
MFEILQQVIDWYLAHINYATIFILMAIESSFIPFPSEVVIPPAAYKAAQGDLNIFLVLLAGTLGAIAGALFNYFFALFLGRKIVYKLANTKLAHLMLINEGSIVKAEKYFVKHGNSSTLIGRLVPAVRQLISLPAGLARMNLSNFILYTFIGSAIWNGILCVLGYLFYQKQDVLHLYYKDVTIGLLVVGGLYVAYEVYKSFKKDKKA